MYTPPPQDLVADQPERFFVSEIIREQVFLQYRQEVPYAVSVACTDFKARPHAKDYVEVCMCEGVAWGWVMGVGVLRKWCVVCMN